MNAVRTTSDATRDEPRTLERSGRLVVALALRDKALSAIVAARFAAEGDVVVWVCPAVDAAQLTAWLEEKPADVLLLDERWLHRLGPSSVPCVRAHWPDRRVLLVAALASTALVDKVVRNRFQGFLLVEDAADACSKAVRAVIRGEMWVPRALLVQALFEHVHPASPGQRATDSKLTRREADIVGYVRRGFANKQIAEALAIREDTVKKHLRNAYTKLGVHRRTEIITGAAERLAGGS
jgi:DNA-binding NarL/FixJ family response regulator